MSCTGSLDTCLLSHALTEPSSNVRCRIVYLILDSRNLTAQIRVKGTWWLTNAILFTQIVSTMKSTETEIERIGTVRRSDDSYSKCPERQVQTVRLALRCRTMSDRLPFVGATNVIDY